MFENGLQYVRSDFHLHTNKDKEFTYTGEQNSFVNDYVSALKEANISVGVITNHNKFDIDEYKAIRKAAKKARYIHSTGSGVNYQRRGKRHSHTHCV